MSEHDCPSHRVSACIFGAAQDTGNLGVSALGLGAASALWRRGISRVAIADYSKGIGPLEVSWPHVGSSLVRFGGYLSRKWYMPESFANMRLRMALGLRRSGPVALVDEADALLDLSGGDSFTDLYGPHRLRLVSAPKQLALSLRKPLILLPQTYGPFGDTATRRSASQLVRGAAQCWARDGRSFEILRDLLGDSFDPARHRQGVDVAFLLPVTSGLRLRRPAPDGNGCSSGGCGEVGINVSGLIWNDPAESRVRYSFKADYREALSKVVLGLAPHTAVVLVPHVLAPREHFESDRRACQELAAGLPESVRSVVRISPDPSGPCEAKGLIASLDWFMGTRMHATIAGLSSGVPTAAISYSDKTLGVFETCGQGEHVHDPRKLSTDELVERVMWSFQNRERARASLAQHLPAVLRQAEEQMDAIASVVKEASLSRSTGTSKAR